MRPVVSTILAASSLTMGLTLAPAAEAQSASQSREKCYGVALAGADDGTGLEAIAGQSTVNYQGNAWVWVKRGTCATTVLPVQEDGTPRRGALEPLERDRPAG